MCSRIYHGHIKCCITTGNLYYFPGKHKSFLFWCIDGKKVKYKATEDPHPRVTTQHPRCRDLPGRPLPNSLLSQSRQIPLTSLGPNRCWAAKRCRVVHCRRQHCDASISTKLWAWSARKSLSERNWGGVVSLLPPVQEVISGSRRPNRGSDPGENLLPQSIIIFSRRRHVSL